MKLNRIDGSTALGSNYRYVWTAAVTSNLGDGVFVTALPLIAVTMTRDPFSLSMVTAAATVPWLAFALVSGALVDRWDRVATMWRVDLIRFVVAAVLAVAVAGGVAGIPVLIVAALALGTAETIFDTASLAAIPGLVGNDRERLTKANARLEGATIVANGFAGPPLGASLFAVAPALAVGVDAISFLGSTVLLRRVRTPPASARTTPASKIRTEIADGVRWLRNEPLLRAFAIVVGAINMATAGAGALLVLLLAANTASGTASYAVVLTVAAAAALAGNVIAERTASRIAPRRLLPVAVSVIAVALTIVAAAARPLIIGAAYALIGLAGGLWNVVTVAIRQVRIPEHLLGRVNSVYRLIAYGTMPLGALAAGAVARATSLRLPFLIGGAAVATTVPMLVRALRRDGTH